MKAVITKRARAKLGSVGPRNRCRGLLEPAPAIALLSGLDDGIVPPPASFPPPRLDVSGRLAGAFLKPAPAPAVPVPPSTTADDIRPVELVYDCVQGSAGAWEAFVRRYAPLILAIARRSLRARGLTPAPDDLEDICENTFLALVKDDFSLLRSYDDRFALSTFLGVVARTQAGRFARRRRAGGSEVDVSELPSRVDDPADAVEAGDLRAALHETLEEMPERDRQILTMFYFSDRDYREIATELKISANSVGAALHRARERLKARLEARDRRCA